MDNGEDDPYVCNLSGACLGKALIICNSFEEEGIGARKGAKKDVENMQKMFKALKFSTEECFWNTDADELKRRLKEIAKSEELKEYQCFACVISSHGHEEERGAINYGQLSGSNVKTYTHVLAMKNNRFIETNEILEIFDDDNCAALKGKPKIFFVQGCRNRNGEREGAMDSGVTVDVQGESRGDAHTNLHSTMDPSVPIPPTDNQGSATVQNFQSHKRVYSPRPAPPTCRNHFLVMYSCVSGAVSWSYNEEGGWLLCKLYEVITEKINRKQNLNLLEVVTEVTGRMSRDCESRVVQDDNPSQLNEQQSYKKCAPCYESKLTKEVNFKLF